MKGSWPNRKGFLRCGVGGGMGGGVAVCILVTITATDTLDNKQYVGYLGEDIVIAK